MQKNILDLQVVFIAVMAHVKEFTRFARDYGLVNSTTLVMTVLIN